MTTFSDPELKLIRQLAGQPPQSVLQIRQACPTHSVCNPLPLFRLYKIDDLSFEARWNGFHEQGTMQVFQFKDV